MTTEQKKEELRKKFDLVRPNARSFSRGSHVEGSTIDTVDILFDWFYSEIEARERSITIIAKEVQRLEDIIKAQNDVIEKAKKMDAFVVEALESYNKLKSKT